MGKVEKPPAAAVPSPVSPLPTRLLGTAGGWKRYINLGEQRRVSRGDTVARGGEAPDYCYAVIEGRVVGGEATAFGEERLYNVMDEGAVFLEPNLLFHYPAPVDFVAAADTALIRIGREALLAAMAADPALAMDILESVSCKFFAAMDGLRESHSHTTPWRICGLLLDFARRYGVADGSGILIRERLSQKTMAGLLGVNRVTMARAMKVLQEAGVVRRQGDFLSIPGEAEMRRYQELLDERAYGK